MSIFRKFLTQLSCRVVTVQRSQDVIIRWRKIISRRVFLQSLTALFGGFALPALTQAKPAAKQWKTLQISSVAGFQYHRGETLWPQLATGQPLTLIREPGNRFDWQGEKLGYIPAIDNAAISQLLDRGKQLSALIVGLKKSNNPWERIEVEVR